MGVGRNNGSDTGQFFRTIPRELFNDTGFGNTKSNMLIPGKVLQLGVESDQS